MSGIHGLRPSTIPKTKVDLTLPKWQQMLDAYFILVPKEIKKPYTIKRIPKGITTAAATYGLKRILPK